MKFTSGQSHANENVTVWTESDETVTEAAMAAPIDDPGSEGIDVSVESKWSKDPHWKAGHSNQREVHEKYLTKNPHYFSEINKKIPSNHQGS